MVAQIKARTKDKSFAGLKGNQKKKGKTQKWSASSDSTHSLRKIQILSSFVTHFPQSKYHDSILSIIIEKIVKFSATERLLFGYGKVG